MKVILGICGLLWLATWVVDPSGTLALISVIPLGLCVCAALVDEAGKGR
jgi:hypothetical protein